MGWKVLKLQVKPTPRHSVPGVSVSWRFVDTEKNHLVVNVTKALVEHMGWERVRRVLIMAGTEENVGKIYIVPAPPGSKDSRSAGIKGGTMSISFPMENVQSERRAAQPAQYEVARGGIEVTLPDWAARERIVAKTDRSLSEVAEVVERQPFVSIMSRVADPNIGRRFG